MDGGLHSMVMAPLQSDRGLSGILVLARSTTAAFSSADCDFLRQLSEHVALASNQARISLISQQLDTKLNPGAVKDMQAQAAALREADDNSGAFVIIEQVNDGFSFIDRYWKTYQRQSGGFPG